MIICDAFYLSSNMHSIIKFDFEIDFEPTQDMEGFAALSRIFFSQVEKFGKDISFPEKILAGLGDEDFDRLLHDCEFAPEETFFIALNGHERLFSIIDGKEYRMCGSNGRRVAFRTVDGRHVDVVTADDAHKIFGKAL